MLDDILAIPDHIRDAIWRTDSARLVARPSAGFMVCGMGGSAIGGELARGILGERLTGPMVVVRSYRLPRWVNSDWAVLGIELFRRDRRNLFLFHRGRRGRHPSLGRRHRRQAGRIRPRAGDRLRRPARLLPAPRDRCLHDGRRNAGRQSGRGRARRARRTERDRLLPRRFESGASGDRRRPRARHERHAAGCPRCRT